MRIDSKTDTTLEFSGPGLRSTEQNPLLGISSGRLMVTGNAIWIRAELGGVSQLFRMMLLFLVSLAIALCAVLWLALHGRLSTPLLLALGIAPLTPWIVLLPLMNRRMKRVTVRAIKTLLDNLSVAARHDGHRTLPLKSSVS